MADLRSPTSGKSTPQDLGGLVYLDAHRDPMDWPWSNEQVRTLVMKLIKDNPPPPARTNSDSASIARMTEAGLVRESDGRVDSEMDDERRIYSLLTGAGRTALEAELKRYRGVVAVAEGRLAHGH